MMAEFHLQDAFQYSRSELVDDIARLSAVCLSGLYERLERHLRRKLGVLGISTEHGGILGEDALLSMGKRDSLVAVAVLVRRAVEAGDESPDARKQRMASLVSTLPPEEVRPAPEPPSSSQPTPKAKERKRAWWQFWK